MLNKLKTQLIFVLLFSILLVSSVSALSATRSFSATSINVSQAINVSITVSASDATVYGVDEAIPSGWTISNINEGGTLANGKISWLFLDNTNRVLSYQATAPASAGTYNFVGNYTDGSTLSQISGDSQVTVSDSNPGASPQIKINEFVSDPDGSGDEWIELYNPTSSLLDLTDWTIEDGTASPKSLTGKQISAQGYLVLEKNQNDFTFALNNAGDIIILRDSSSTIIDSVSFGDWNDGSTADNALVTFNGNSTGRLPNGVDTNVDNNDFVLFESPTKSALNQIINDSNPNPDPTPSNETNDLMVNYVRGKIIIDGSPASTGYEYTLNVLTGANAGTVFTGTVDSIIPTQHLNKGYFDTRDQLAFSTGDNFRITISGFPDCSAEGTFINGGNGWFEPETNLTTLNCNSPNSVPTFTNIPTSVQGSENTPIEFQVNATDLDNDTLTFSASGLLSAFFNVVTRIFSWTPGFDDSGTHQLQLTVSDGENSTTKNVTITVSNVNRAPALDDISDKTLDEDSSISFNITANDEDSEDTITYSISQESESDVSCSVTKINNTLSTVTIDAENSFNGNAFCTVQVSDTSNALDSQEFAITVSPVNDAPSIIGLQTSLSANEGEKVTITVNATDVDSDPLTITINDTRFTNPLDGIFEWTPGFSDSGIHKVEITVSDAITSTKAVITITIIDANQPPILDLIPDFIIAEDSGPNVLTTLSATDIDGTISGFTITSEDKNKVNCSISGNELSATPELNFFGSASCTVTVTDNSGGTDSQPVSITVTNVNDAPVINSISPTYVPKIPEDGSFNFSVSWTDVDALQSNVTVTWLRNGTVDGSGNTYNFIGDGTKDILKFNITVVVSDGEFSDTRETEIITSNIPLTDKYDGDTTPFDSSMPDTELECVYLILEVQGKGKSLWLDCVDLRNVVDLDRYSDISSGLIALDSNTFTSFKNKKAELTMFSLSNEKTPSIKYNSGYTTTSSSITQACPGTICSSISYVSNNLKFQITGFSSFSSGPTPSCSSQGGDLCTSSESCFGSTLTSSDAGICCSVSCSATPPSFNGINTCGNLSSLIDLRIKDPNNNDNFDIGEIIDISLRIKNLDTEKHDYDIEAHLYNVDQDDSEEDVDENLKVKSGKTETIDFELEIPDDLDDSDRYVLYIKAEDGSLCTEDFVDLDIERLEDDVIISSFSLLPKTVSCGSLLEAKVKVENRGSDDQDVVIIVSSDALGIRQETEEFQLDQFDDDDDKETRTLLFQVPLDAEEGDYTVRADVSFSGEESTETQVISVKGCGGINQLPGIIDLGARTSNNQILLTGPSPTPQAQPSVNRIYLRDYSGFDLGTSRITFEKTGTIVKPVGRSSYSILSVMISATESAIVKWLVIGIFILITLIFIVGIFMRRFPRFR